MGKRNLITVFVLLLLGAVINVSVAWTLAWRVAPPRTSNTTLAQFISGSDPAQQWLVMRADEFGTTRITGGLASGRVRGHPPTSQVLPWWSRFETIARQTGDAAVGQTHADDQMNPGSPAVPLGIVEDARGWPLRSMRLWWNHGLSSEAIPHDELLHGGILLKPYPPQNPGTFEVIQERALPLRPIAIGFIVNTLFYASIIAILYVLLIVVKRLLRRTPGACPKCGYPAGTSPVCTECGAPLPADFVRPMSAESVE